MEAICFDLVAFFWRVMRVFLSGIRRILYLFNVFFSVCRITYLIILGAWAFLGRVGRLVMWKQCFSMTFRSKLMLFMA